MRNLHFFVAIVIAVTGCATAGKISSVRLGMTKQQVIDVMGPPASISAQGQTEYLNYALSETDDQALHGVDRPYYVRFINGRVDSFGRTGDFDSIKTPKVRVEVDLYTELKKMKELKDSGIITEEEFQAQKKKLLEKK